MPRVVVAASNVYDSVYLQRNLGLALIPWPGLSSQLSRIAYTGDGPNARREVLFCCGAQPYNKPIEQFAQVIVNATRRVDDTLALMLTRRTRRHNAVDSPQSATRERVTFAWLNDLYPKSYQCKKRQVDGSTGSTTTSTGQTGHVHGSGRRLAKMNKLKMKPKTVTQCGCGCQ